MDMAATSVTGTNAMNQLPFLPLARMLAASALVTLAGGAHAQAAFPQQPIRIVVPAPAGGGYDVIARILGNAITANTQWTVIVDNKAGASGIIGTDAVAKAKPDGHTLNMAGTGTIFINSEMFRTLPFDVLKDFVPVSTISEQPMVLVVPANSPHRTVADLVKAHQAKNMTMASAGAGALGQLVGDMFGRVVGAKFTNVPYKGTAPALQDLVGGVTDLMFATPAGALPLLQGGRLRALALTSAKRIPLLPDVPTLVESGYPKFQVSEWKILLAPAGTPPAVVERLNKEVQKALAQTSTIARVLADGSLPRSSSVSQAQQFVKAEMERWASAVKESGLSKTN